jgi:hypothetical protein
MKNSFAAFALVSGIVALQFTEHVFAETGSYTVHEWGTFTDVQGGDGKLLSWRPLQTSELPDFVRSWQNPGMNRRFAGFFLGNEPTIVTGVKQMMVTLQRLETPVMYFYSSNDLAVDVSVKFPSGLITEWFPQATKIGPSVPLSTNASDTATLPDSRAEWKQLQLFSESKHHGQFQNQFPQNQSGHHYLAARETGADAVRMEFADGTREPDNYEKFIFYRGAGSFKTPLRVSVNERGEIVVANTGEQPLAHLFLLKVKNGGGGFEEIESLPPGESETFPALENINSTAQHFCLPADGRAKLGAAVHAALVSAGLFDDEAAAMVNTWRDSWFAEDGVRVLYLLPRQWTDETLPLTLNPVPKKIVRVMVGRAEIIMPDTVNDLATVLTKAEDGDDDAKQQAVSELTKFGRFAEPTLLLVNRGERSQSQIKFSYQLLSETVQPKSNNQK